jgi:hypothetical protein
MGFTVEEPFFLSSAKFEVFGPKFSDQKNSPKMKNKNKNSRQVFFIHGSNT